MSKRSLAVAALLGAVLIWGTTFVATKIALRDVPPFSLSLLRLLLGALLLLPLVWAEQRRSRDRLAWLELALAGLLGGCLYFAFQNLGMVYTSASQASLILASIPALTALLSVVWLRERLGMVRAAGIAASVSGVVVMVVAGGNIGWGRGGFLGDLLVFGSALSWALYTVQVKRSGAKASPLVLTTASMGFGAIFLGPLAAHEVVTHPTFAVPLAAWAAIAYLGVMASAAAFLLWNYALASVDASEAAVYTNLVPVVAIATSVSILHETVSPFQIAGGVLVLVGVWLSSGMKKTPASHDRVAKVR